MAASVPASRWASSGTGRVPGSTVSTSSCRVTALEAAAVVALSEVTPGTISVG